ncbi:FGGY family carbohydrate kinase [Hoeflea ulvae]|uniref:FGGY family carbohydrate kinase n=1 Tax=Hoeflea ulvae TaxID=2983764 RepID=A0ABT3YCG7_9HYPH|nr:FGGY family carbohydrate kinase [Hoeflea ulvae]MCY0093450.1 FGGY family carbohydrate kinase [Hoeflea ulvae]
MASDLVLCLDSGTTSVKAAVYDRNGHAVARAETPNAALLRSGNRVEQDMDRTLADARQVIAACLDQVEGTVSALALTAQGDGLWPLSGDLAPAGKAITWLDGRAAELVAGMADALDVVETITSARPTSASQTLQLLWLQHNEPERFAAIRYALRLKEWLFFSFTGELRAEYGSLLPAWGDWRTGKPIGEVSKALGLEKGTELLPEPGTVTSAGLSSQAARQLRLPEGLPVVLGPGDVQSSFVGLGVGPGLALTRGSVFGTSAVHGGYYAGIGDIPDKPSGAMIQRFATGQGFICFHPCFNGGNLMRHVADLVGGDLPRNDRPAYSGVVLHPFFEPGGERAPVTNPLASAAAFGLGADTTAEQLGWAARESLAFLARMSHAELGDDGKNRIVVGGGVARDPVLMQLLATVLGRSVLPHSGGDTALRGLAAIAMGALDAGPDRGKPDETYLSPSGTEIQPETGAVPAFLSRKMELFEQLLADVSRHWEELAKVREDAAALTGGQI